MKYNVQQNKTSAPRSATPRNPGKYQFWIIGDTRRLKDEMRID